MLVADFASDEDPIFPIGERENGLLESAVGRQFSGYGGVLKYPHPLSNAASLVFGICCDHVFHNGNKRTALVAMLLHLDRNNYSLPGVSQDELYSIMIAIADHRIGLREDHRRRAEPPERRHADEEVDHIYTWLRRHAEKITTGEKVISYRQLRQILARFGIQMENCGQNQAELVRYVEQNKGLIFKKSVKVRERLGVVGYRDEGTAATRGELHRIRQLCRLTEEDGVDSTSFYTTGEIVDGFIIRYRRVLRRLGKR